MLNQVVAAKLEKYAQFFEDFDNKAAQKSSLYEQLYDQPDVNVVDVKKLQLTDYEKECSKQLFCIPLSADVREVSFKKLAKSQLKSAGRLFDVITMDPPWILSTVKQVRGVKTNYTTLNDNDILNGIPFPKIQKDGFLFIWVINAKYRFALTLFTKYGYKLVDELVWVK